MTTDSKAAEDRMHAAIDRIAGERLNVRLLPRRAGRRDEATVHPILDRVLRDGLATAYREGFSAALASTARAGAGREGVARAVYGADPLKVHGEIVPWADVGGPHRAYAFKVADAVLAFYQSPAVPASPRSGDGEGDGNWEEWFAKQIAYSESFRECAARMGVDHPFARGRTSAFQEMQERFLAGTKVVTGELEGYLLRQIEWSRRVFGEKLNAIGITRHIEKECAEIRDNPTDLSEWCDVITLALDGFWRHGGHPSSLIEVLNKNQERNTARKWNVSKDPNVPSEHDRSGEASPPAPAEHGVEIRERIAAALWDHDERQRASDPVSWAEWVAYVEERKVTSRMAEIQRYRDRAQAVVSALSQGGQAGGSEKGKGEENGRVTSSPGYSSSTEPQSVSALSGEYPSRGGLADGCCSSRRPCDYQKRHPSMICEICERTRA